MLPPRPPRRPNDRKPPSKTAPPADVDSRQPEAAAPRPEPEAAPPEPAAKAPKPRKAPDPPAPPVGAVQTQGVSDKLAEIKVVIFNDLLEAVDLAEISKLSTDQVREEISDMTAEIISMRGLVLTI